MAKVKNDMGKFNVDNIDVPDFSMSEPESNGRTPSKSRKIVTDHFKSLGKGALERSRQEIKERMPEAYDLTTEAIGTINDTKEFISQFNKDLSPALNSFKVAALRSMPFVKKLVPTKIYDSVEQKLKDSIEPEQRANREEDQRSSTIMQSLNEVFGAQIQIQKQADIQSRTDKLIDRQLDSVRFKASDKAMRSIDARLMFQNKFMAGTMTAYMKKSLELKYQHLFVAKDTLAVTKVMAKLLDVKLEEIKHNTALPEYAKTNFSEYIKGSLKTSVSQRIGSYVNDFRAKLFKNAKDYVKSNIIDPLTSIGSMADMGSSFLEMGKDMGMNKDLEKKDILFFATKQLASILGSQAVRKGAKFLDAFAPDVNNALSNWKTKFALGANEFKRKNEYGGSFLKRLLASIIPEYNQNVRINNTVWGNDRDIVGFDNTTRTAIVEVIPGYLAMMNKHLTKIATGRESRELVYNPTSRKFETKANFVRNLETAFLGDKEGRAYAISQTAGSVAKAFSVNVKGANLRDFVNNEKDVKRFILNSGLYKKALNLDIIKQYITDPYYFDESGYISSVTKGMQDPKSTLTMLAASFTKKDGTFDNIWYSKFSNSVIEAMNIDNMKEEFERIANVHGHRRHLGKYIDKYGNLDLNVVRESYLDSEVSSDRRSMSYGFKNTGRYFKSEEERIKRFQDLMQSTGKEYNEANSLRGKLLRLNVPIISALAKYIPDNVDKSLSNGVNYASAVNMTEHEEEGDIQSIWTRVSTEEGRDELINNTIGRIENYVTNGDSNKALKEVNKAIESTRSDLTKASQIKNRRKRKRNVERLNAELEILESRRNDILKNSSSITQKLNNAYNNSALKIGIDSTLNSTKEYAKEFKNNFMSGFPTKEEVLSSVPEDQRAEVLALMEKCQTTEDFIRMISSNDNWKKWYDSSSNELAKLKDPEERKKLILKGITKSFTAKEYIKNKYTKAGSWLKNKFNSYADKFLTSDEDAAKNKSIGDKFFDKLEDLVNGKTEVRKSTPKFKLAEFAFETKAESGFHKDFQDFALQQMSANKALLEILQNGTLGNEWGRHPIIGSVVNSVKGVGRFGANLGLAGVRGIYNVYGGALRGAGSVIGGGLKLAAEAAPGLLNLLTAAMPAIGNMGSGLLSGLGSLGKGYLNFMGGLTRGVGSAIGGVASGVGSAFRGLFGAGGLFRNPFKPSYVDIYLKDNIAPGKEILTAKKQKEGVVFANGERVKKSSQITAPVYDPVSKEILITHDDIKRGLVNVEGEPIAERLFGGPIINNIFDMFKSVFRFGSSVGSTAMGLYGGLGKLLFQGAGMGLRGIGKLGARIFGLDTSLSKEYCDKMTALVTEIRNMMKLTLKKRAGDRDGDGDIDNSAEDLAAQYKEEEKERQERHKQMEQNRRSAVGPTHIDDNGNEVDSEGNIVNTATDLYFANEMRKDITGKIKGSRIYRKSRISYTRGKKGIGRFISKIPKIGRFGKVATIGAGVTGAGAIASNAVGASASGVGSATGATAVASKVGSKALPKILTKLAVKGGTKLGALALNGIPVAGQVLSALAMAGLMGYDAYDGWNRAGEISGKDPSKISWHDKGSAAAGNILSGITLGLMPEKWGYNIAKYTPLGLLAGGAGSAIAGYNNLGNYALKKRYENDPKYAEMMGYNPEYGILRNSFNASSPMIAYRGIKKYGGMAMDYLGYDERDSMMGNIGRMGRNAVRSNYISAKKTINYLKDPNTIESIRKIVTDPKTVIKEAAEKIGSELTEWWKKPGPMIDNLKKMISTSFKATSDFIAKIKDPKFYEGLKKSFSEAWTNINTTVSKYMSKEAWIDLKNKASTWVQDTSSKAVDWANKKKDDVKNYLVGLDKNLSTLEKYDPKAGANKSIQNLAKKLGDNESEVILSGRKHKLIVPKAEERAYGNMTPNEVLDNFKKKQAPRLHPEDTIRANKGIPNDLLSRKTEYAALSRFAPVNPQVTTTGVKTSAKDAVSKSAVSQRDVNTDLQMKQTTLANMKTSSSVETLASKFDKAIDLISVIVKNTNSLGSLDGIKDAMLKQLDEIKSIQPNNLMINANDSSAKNTESVSALDIKKQTL